MQSEGSGQRVDMIDLAIARAIHVLAVVVWIGGVAMVTTVILPMVRRAGTPTEGQTLLEAVERRFVWHAVVLLWLIFTIVLFIGEPLAGRIRRGHGSQLASKGRLSLMQWLHWTLLLLSAITVFAAVAGSHGMSLVP
jgi:uncharacterized membrane protein